MRQQEVEYGLYNVKTGTTIDEYELVSMSFVFIKDMKKRMVG